MEWAIFIDKDRIPKGNNDWYKSNIDMLVEAAECVAHNNKHMIDGRPLYDIDGYFPKWIAIIIHKKLNHPNPNQ